MTDAVVRLLLTVIVTLGCLLTCTQAFEVSYQTNGRNALQATTSKEDVAHQPNVDANRICSSSTRSTLSSPLGQQITLIGTSHISQTSCDQVERILYEIRPNVVMIELDPDRLAELGVKINDISVENVVTSQDITLPTTSPTSNDHQRTPWFLQPLRHIQDVLFSWVVQRLTSAATTSYHQRSDESGLEFLAAIRAAEHLTECHTLVLGDCSSINPFQRTAQLARGGVMGLWGRLLKAQTSVNDELKLLQHRARTRLSRELDGDSDRVVISSSLLRVSMMETLKNDAELRDRLLRKLSRELPEFAQAFLIERDYVMAESIRREMKKDERCAVDRVVCIVGLAHLQGIEENLRSMFANKPTPLETMADNIPERTR